MLFKQLSTAIPAAMPAGSWFDPILHGLDDASAWFSSHLAMWATGGRQLP